MSTTIQGVQLEGVTISGAIDFSSIENLICDWDVNTVIMSGPNVTAVIDRSGNGNIISATLPATYYRIIDGYLENSLGTISYKNFDSNRLNAVMTKQQPFGIYLICKVTGAGTTETISPILLKFGASTQYHFQIRFNDLDGSGRPKLRFIQASAATVTTTNGVTVNEEICIWKKVGPNNQAGNQVIGYNGTVLSTTQRNQTATATNNNLEHRCHSTDRMRMKRLLVYDWAGKTQSEVNALDVQIKALITQKYGMTF